MTLEDLSQYEAKWRAPITFSYKDLKITSMSPPSSGGFCLNQIMKMIDLLILLIWGKQLRLFR
jgi:gamma-glutamyltranspeptidase/glutathione hydrolase